MLRTADKLYSQQCIAMPDTLLCSLFEHTSFHMLCIMRLICLLHGFRHSAASAHAVCLNNCTACRAYERMYIHTGHKAGCPALQCTAGVRLVLNTIWALHQVTCGDNLDQTCTSLQSLQFVHRASLENQATCADYMIVETITSFVQF